VRLFDHAVFRQWVCLEAHADVLQFCEYPARLGSGPEARLVDFWVRDNEGERFLVIGDADFTAPAIEGVALQQVTSAELAAAAISIENWQRMLATITTCRSLVPKSLLRSVLALVSEPTPLSRIEHELSAGDPMLVRAGVFDLLRTGRLRAPSLHTKPLSLHSLVEPAP
jgi:hypothetical protein